MDKKIQVSISEFMKRMGAWFDAVEKGEEIRITRRGKVIAVMKPVQREN